MLQQQISSNLQFQTITLTHNYLQDYLKFDTDYIHAKYSFYLIDRNYQIFPLFLWALYKDFEQEGNDKSKDIKIFSTTKFTVTLWLQWDNKRSDLEKETK